MNIENIVLEKNITHMEAILDYCQRNDLEPDTVGKLISKSLKEKIEANARELNFLPRQAQLPVQDSEMYTIYTQNRCVFCTMAKKLLDDNDIEFLEINIHYDDTARILLKEQGFKTVPQIYDDDNNHIGGYTDLAEIYNKNDRTD